MSVRLVVVVDDEGKDVGVRAEWPASMDRRRAVSIVGRLLDEVVETLTEQVPELVAGLSAASEIAPGR